MPQLISIPVSPWSERAKFALHVAGFHRAENGGVENADPRAIEVVDYVAMLNEPWLRWIMGEFNPFKKVTVPVLRLADGTLINDSIGIAKWAADQSNGALKVPDEALLAKVTELTEIILANGRYRSLSRCYEEGAFDAETLPPGPLRMLPDPVIKFNIRIVCRYLLRKHSTPGQTYESSLETMRQALAALQLLLDNNGGRFLMGKEGFSIADIVAAGSMSFVAPLPLGRSLLGPNMGRCWVEPDLAAEFKDLIAWRDALYMERRGVLNAGKL